MPRFFIDTDDGYLAVNDEEGFDFAEQTAARNQALRALAEMIKDALPDGDTHTFKAVVRD